jgi:hypothetical protein
MKTTTKLLSGLVAMMVATGALAFHNGVIHGSQLTAPHHPKPIVFAPLSATRPR